MYDRGVRKGPPAGWCHAAGTQLWVQLVSSLGFEPVADLCEGLSR